MMLYQQLVNVQACLQQLIKLLEIIHNEGQQLANAGYSDVNLRFIETAIANFKQLAQQFETGLLTKDANQIIYVLLSIDSANRYFAEADLDWSNKWHSSKLFDSLQRDIENLLYEQRIHEKVDILQHNL